MPYIEVVLNVPLRQSFTYESDQDVPVGARVTVNFRGRDQVGFCVGKTQGKPQYKIKPVSEIIDDKPLLPQDYWDWLNQGADYYCASLGQVLNQALPDHFFFADPEKRNKERRARTLEIPKWKTVGEVQLTDEQQGVADDVLQHQNEFYPLLLHGVTGSGKTEVYIQIMKAVLAAGKSVIYLVPEIGLTPQTLGRLNAHFEDQLLLLHSGLTPNQRYIQWMKAQSDKPQVLVGTRSSLFAPFENLGLIIVDEEHDSSYKQEDRFRYHARDMALLRAHRLKIPLIMGSATPSLESYHLAKSGQYKYVQLKDRVGKSTLPQVDLIDIAKERTQTHSVLHLSQHIHRKIDQYVEAGEQVILFIGQRGFAQNAFCTACQTVQHCPNCSVGLKHHTHQNLLKCHYCDFDKAFDEVCSHCGEKSLTLLGVGIQALEEEVREQHPKVRMQRVDSDAFPTPQKLTEVFQRFQDHEMDLILGTQMMTKGHDFAKVGFVGVAGLEAQMGLPDFRANERSFQNLVQVAGRAGRQEKRGLVLVQSHTPDAMSLKFGIEQDFEGFAKEELELREQLFYPPFSRLVQIRLVANQEKHLKNFLKKKRSDIQKMRADLLQQNIMLLGPTEAPLSKLRGWHRHHMIVKLPRRLQPSQVVEFVQKRLDLKSFKSIDVQIDVDPLSLL